MATTPNYGWPVPDAPDPDNVPKDMLTLAVPIDALVKQLEDRIDAREKIHVTHAGDGVYEFYNGLGEPVTVEPDGAGGYTLLQ